MAAKDRILKELKQVSASPYAAHLTADDPFQWTATIKGCDNTPYQGGTFHVSIAFPADYPFKPPAIMFTTAVFHPNVAADGRVVLDILRDKWSPALTVEKALIAVEVLLAEARPYDPVNAEAAALYVEDRDAYDRQAREWTSRYAATG
ncbi:ubiquitin-conjugating enzyme E2 [Streptomyces lavendulae]|uniref:ubiquitin-conjugating enzyme E2 n=1 Tax=Streptomyces lavendulae TaxID=1914 RepID=UPI0036BF509C